MSDPSKFPRMDNTAGAIAAILFSVAALSLGDAIIKAISVDIPLWQLYVLRSLFVLPVLAAMVALKAGTVRLLPRRLFWTALRSLLLVVMWVAYYASLPHLQLSLAAAAYYTSPLFITLFSAGLAGERVGARRWFAIALGFAGVIVMLRPDAHGFDAWALLPVAAAVCYTLAMILTRTRCRDEDPLILSMALNIAFIVVGGIASLVLLQMDLSPDRVAVNPFLFGGWTDLDGMSWAALAILGAAMLVGSVFAAIAYQTGASSTVSAFDYSYLAFSAVWGLLFFAETPDMLTVTGMAMIATAGIIAVRSRPAVRMA